MAKTDKVLVTRARTLRRNPTEAEKRLWSILKAGQIDGHRFRRQHPVGPYVLDFASIAAQLGIEADGGQHADSGHDARRDAFLAERGWRILRFWNNDIMTNIEGVREMIAAALAEACPHPGPPPAKPGEGE